MRYDLSQYKSACSGLGRLSLVQKTGSPLLTSKLYTPMEPNVGTIIAHILVCVSAHICRNSESCKSILQFSSMTEHCTLSSLGSGRRAHTHRMSSFGNFPHRAPFITTSL
ncbi:hypothetical protein KC19_4G219200 [Ceratodon purpureus]|uniref:Uncharacterized protein n=1 Tax=Ceratodon purpureus TaxID=3225 RepID=A0A8T0ICA3_CERPU|nr:hypothetical protein KC19_4G219200 [Ceratodon purpureus]